jgi:hypothetical protein
MYILNVKKKIIGCGKGKGKGKGETYNPLSPGGRLGWDGMGWDERSGAERSGAKIV